MKRRDFIALLGGTAATWPIAARAQQPQRMHRLGVLMGLSENDAEARGLVETFVRGLEALGWADGHNLQIDYRWATGNVERLQAPAKEIVARAPDVILVVTTPAAVAVARETRTIPVVFVVVSDPIGAGLVESLARPGGNITGFINLEGAMGGKWLEVLKEAVPSIKRAAIMFNPLTAPGGGNYFLPAFEAAARTLGVTASPAPVRDAADIQRTIASFAREPHGGLVVMPDNTMQLHRATILLHLARHKLPGIGYNEAWAKEGALLSYGHNNMDLFRRAAPYVDRVLRGAKASDLPVQLPTKFELFVNLKTTKALGLTIPESFLLRADEVIE